MPGAEKSYSIRSRICVEDDAGEEAFGLGRVKGLWGRIKALQPSVDSHQGVAVEADRLFDSSFDPDLHAEQGVKPGRPRDPGAFC